METVCRAARSSYNYTTADTMYYLSKYVPLTPQKGLAIDQVSYMSHLLHPELVGNARLGGASVRNSIENRCGILSAGAKDREWPAVTVVIRTLNEREQLGDVFNDFESQDYPKDRIRYVVVDNESGDGTQDVAIAAGARIKNIPRSEFTYPKSLNVGLFAAESEFVVVVSAHVKLATTMFLQAGIVALEGGAAGVYAWPPLPAANASLIERVGIGVMQHRLRSRVYDLRTARWGALCMAGSMIRRSAWESVGGFDESFETGGEDTDLARRLIRNDERIVFDPAMTIHHTHGLSFRNRLRRTLHLSGVLIGGKGLKFNRERLMRHRPDLGLEG